MSQDGIPIELLKEERKDVLITTGNLITKCDNLFMLVLNNLITQMLDLYSSVSKHVMVSKLKTVLNLRNKHLYESLFIFL